MSLRIGDTFAGYRVLRLLGSGGMGEVYLVQHPRLPRQEALKILRPDFSQDSAFRERFIREADLASGLRHPHIVGIHDRGEHDGQLWIAMDYIEGADLSQLLAQRYLQGMPVGHALSIVTAISSALDYAHKKGLLHRDVKPANIIVADLETDDPKVLLADFGIARPLDDTGGITTTNMTVGTVAYAAPEQLMGEDIDGRADQYALAAATYHLLAGAQPFPHTNPAVVISRHLNAPAPALADVRPDLTVLDPILASALAKHPDNRFERCTDFARALTEAVDPQAIRTDATPTTPAAHRRPVVRSPSAIDRADAHSGSARSVSWQLIGVSAVVALLLGGVAALWRPWNHLPDISRTDTVPSTNASVTTVPTTTAKAAAPTPVVPPPVTIPATPTTSATYVDSGPKIGENCDDWMKFSTDSATGQEMVCSGLPMAPTKWYSTATGIAAGLGDHPLVGRTGSPCNEPPYTFGRSSDGYAVWCFSGPRALMPGGQWLSTPDQQPVWALYSP